MQKKFEIVMNELQVNPAELMATQSVVDSYQEVVNEVLKMFVLEKYLHKKK